MGKNKTILKIVIVSLVLMALLGYGFISYYSLDEPVFFDHYYDYGISLDDGNYTDVPLNLGYISDIQDHRKIINVTFPEYPTLQAQVNSRDISSAYIFGLSSEKAMGSVYGRYKVNTMFCHFTEFPKDSSLEDIKLTKATIGFDDQSVITVDIGEVYLYDATLKKVPLDFNSTSASSDGTGMTSYKVLDKLRIHQVDNTLGEKFKERVEIVINGTDIAEANGMEFKEDVYLDVSSKVNPPRNWSEKYTIIDIRPKIAFMNNSGEVYSQRFYNIDTYTSNFKFWDLAMYIKAREDK